MLDFILDLLESKYSKWLTARELVLSPVRAMKLNINFFKMITISKLDADLESRIKAANAAVLFALRKEIENLPSRYAMLTDSVMTEEEESELLRIQDEVRRSNENFNLSDYFVGDILGSIKSLADIKNADEVVKEVIYRFIKDMESLDEATSSSLTTQIFEEEDIEYYKSCDAEGICPIQDDEFALYDFNEACVRMGIRKQSLREGLKKGLDRKSVV